ncbi:MAG: DUF5103 domain-containing protein [Paludibacteraceae bacterium]|nr:DUF5103 domain-containing protein [Paludibacteraceae bacterium]
MMNLVVAILLNITSLITAPFHTQVAESSGISTLRVLIDGEDNVSPVFLAGSESTVTITFDDLSYIPQNYYYMVLHCDASWMPSNLTQMEYLDGLDDIMIDEYATSTNTAYNYIHYWFTLPSDFLKLKLSGNYAVLIARDNDFESGLVGVACFSIVEPLTVINATYSPTTVRGINSEWQQLELTADVSRVGSSNPMTEFTMVIRQNYRVDNEVTITQPTFVTGKMMKYTNAMPLVFEAGNQYRSVDFSSRYTYGSGIDRFIFVDSVYKVLLEPDDFLRKRRTDARDAHGAYVVHIQGDYDDDTEADYMWLRFEVSAQNPFLDGRVYVMTGANYNLFDERSMMRYDFERKCYWLEMFLKQGGINYQYIFVPKHGEPSMKMTEGNYWQTNNSYQIYLYYRPFGERYDRLVGYQEIKQ